MSVRIATSGPHQLSFTEALRTVLAVEIGDGRTIMDALVATIILRAIKGDVRAASLIRDTIDGRPMQRVEAAREHVVINRLPPRRALPLPDDAGGAA